MKRDNNILNMLYKNIYKILLFFFTLFFNIILNIIKKDKLYKKYCQLNTIKNILKQNDGNYNKYNIKYIKKIKKVVYSVIIGKYDKILTFKKQEGYNYFLFADQNYKNTNWTIISISKLIEKTNISKIKMTRYYKLFPHLFFKDYDLSIYIDASFIVKGNLNEFLIKTLNPSFDIYFLQHYCRNKILQEFPAVLRDKRDKIEIVNLVKKRYKKENFPDNLGLTENCIIIRRHNNKKVIKLMKIWWNEIKNYSYRDQLSLNYAIWKLNSNLKIYYLSKRFILDYFSYKKHKKPTQF
jgi:hypothetical protein